WSHSEEPTRMREIQVSARRLRARVSYPTVGLFPVTSVTRRSVPFVYLSVADTRTWDCGRWPRPPAIRPAPTRNFRIDSIKASKTGNHLSMREGYSLSCCLHDSGFPTIKLWEV